MIVGYLLTTGATYYKSYIKYTYVSNIGQKSGINTTAEGGDDEIFRTLMRNIIS